MPVNKEVGNLWFKT
jgi:hypothetical protein